MGLTALFLLFYHSLAGGTLLAHNVYDSYSLQAENWLAGRNYIADGETFTWLELAIYRGHYYQSFPPVPGVFLLPWVMLCGSAAAVPSNLVIAIWALFGMAGVFLLFQRRGHSPAICLLFSLFAFVGSNACWMMTSGGVWFMAQVLNLSLVAWGLFFAAGESCPSRVIAAFLLSLAVGCRPFSAILLGLYLLGTLYRDSNGLTRLPERRWWLAAAAAAAVGLFMAGYNLARFGNPLEFGHTYLPEFQTNTYGQFSYHYFFPNLKNLFRPVTLGADLSLQFPLFNGFLFFVADPIFLLWALHLAKRAFTGRWHRSDTAALAGWVLGLSALCFHATLGGWQFGARYLVDFIPYVLASECKAALEAQPRNWEWGICAAAMLFNIYGALYMLF